MSITAGELGSGAPQKQVMFNHTNSGYSGRQLGHAQLVRKYLLVEFSTVKQLKPHKL